MDCLINVLTAIKPMIYFITQEATNHNQRNTTMATLNQAYQAAVNFMNASIEVHSVNIEFMSEISGPMTATVTRDGRMQDVCKM